MHQLINTLEKHSEINASQICLSSAGQELDYRSLWEHTELLKNWLIDMEIQTLAFRLDNGISWALLDIAAAKANVNVIPLPTFFTIDQIQHVMSDAKVELLVLEIDDEQGIDKRLFGQEESIITPALLSAHSYKIFQTLEDNAEASAYKVTYTSGSTGTPKGVLLSYEVIDEVTNSIVSAMADVNITHHLCVLPLATLLENVAGLYAPLLKGIKVSLPSLNTVGLSGASLDVEKFTAVINQHKPDSLILVPQLLTALCTLIDFDLLTHREFEFIAVGGGRVSDKLMAQASVHCLPIFQGYGLSEACSVVSLNLPCQIRDGSVGKPLPHAKIRISDAGEIEVGGAIYSGYLGCSSGNQVWYQTGDLGYFDDDGYLYITGRIKHQFITSFGRNVNPEWAESALSQQVAVSQALITGEARDHNLCLLWLRFPQTTEELAALVASANEGLPDYAQSHNFVVMSGDLDKNLMTANGRLKRAEALVRFSNLINQHYETRLLATANS